MTPIRLAEQLGQRLIAAAIPLPHGGYTWQTLTPVPREVSYHLYDGGTGIALFLAALGQVTHEPFWQEGARQAIFPLSSYLAQPHTRQRLGQRANLGAGIGIGSWLYGLVHLSQWLDRPDLLSAARQAALLITPEKVATDKYYDVLGGAAGAILGLLALYQVTEDDLYVRQAQWCGDYLLSQRVMTAAGYRAWPTYQGGPISGMAHGAAGIAYALARLAAVDASATWREAAHEALLWERTTFIPEHGNWYALGSPEVIYTRWCHGAAGIGLARLGMLPVWDTVEIRQEIDCAVATTAAYPVAEDMVVCCGNVGRWELLITASQTLNQPAWLAQAQHAAAQAVWTETNPTFFKGLAGIGYHYLRLAYPELLPSILLWQ